MKIWIPLLLISGFGLFAELKLSEPKFGGLYYSFQNDTLNFYAQSKGSLPLISSKNLAAPELVKFKTDFESLAIPPLSFIRTTDDFNTSELPISSNAQSVTVEIYAPSGIKEIELRGLNIASDTSYAMAIEGTLASTKSDTLVYEFLISDQNFSSGFLVESIYAVDSSDKINLISECVCKGFSKKEPVSLDIPLNKWVFVTLPTENVTDLQGLLNFENFSLPAYDSTTYRIVSYLNNEFVDIVDSNFQTLNPNDGFWVYTRSALSIQDLEGFSPIEISKKVFNPGYTAIASPYKWAIEIPADSGYAVFEHFYNDSLSGFEFRELESSGLSHKYNLLPYTGYWLLNKGNGLLNLDIKPNPVRTFAVAKKTELKAKFKGEIKASHAKGIEYAYLGEGNYQNSFKPSIEKEVVSLSVDNNFISEKNINGGAIFNIDAPAKSNLEFKLSGLDDYFEYYFYNPNLDINIDLKTFNKIEIAEANTFSYLIAGNQEFVQSKISFLAESSINEFFISKNYPNPFNPSTNFSLRLPTKNKDYKINFWVYNIKGEKVYGADYSRKNGGNFKIKYSAKDLPSGVYYYKIIINKNEHAMRGKFNLIK
jgi:hypothetical protein